MSKRKACHFDGGKITYREQRTGISLCDFSSVEMTQNVKKLTTKKPSRKLGGFRSIVRIRM